MNANTNRLSNVSQLTAENIEGAFRERLAKTGLETCPIKGAESHWDLVVKNSDFIPADDTRSTLNSAEIRFNSLNEPYRNLSTLFYQNKEPVALWSLCARQKSTHWSLGSGLTEVRPPRFIRSIGKKVQKRVLSGCAEALGSLSQFMGLSEWNGVDSLIQGVDLWHRTLLESGARVTVGYDLYVDLDLDLAEIKTRFRSSYKSLINKGMTLWKHEVLNSVSNDVFDEYHAFYNAIAGKTVHTDAAWMSERDAINAGDAFLVLIREHSNELAGAGFFITSPTEAYYAAGAYNRELFHLPLGHVVQMLAIENMKKRGLRWYRLGDRFYSGTPTDRHATAKETTIGEFKEGFASHVIPRMHTRSRAAEGLDQPHAVLVP